MNLKFCGKIKSHGLKNCYSKAQMVKIERTGIIILKSKLRSNLNVGINVCIAS